MLINGNKFIRDLIVCFFYKNLIYFKLPQFNEEEIKRIHLVSNMPQYYISVIGMSNEIKSNLLLNVLVVQGSNDQTIINYRKAKHLEVLGRASA